MKTLADFQTVVDKGLCIYLDQDVDHDMVASLRDQWSKLLKRRNEQIEDKIEPDLIPGAKVAIMLMTPGGGTGYGRSIINQIQAIDSVYEVWMVCHTYIASMGTFIMMSVPKERRVAFADTNFYCHRAKITNSGTFSGSVGDYDYKLKESEASSEKIKKELQALRRLLANGTGMSAKQVRQLEESPEYLSTAAAKRLGFISHILI